MKKSTLFKHHNVNESRTELNIKAFDKIWIVKNVLNRFVFLRRHQYSRDLETARITHLKQQPRSTNWTSISQSFIILKEAASESSSVK